MDDGGGGFEVPDLTGDIARDREKQIKRVVLIMTAKSTPTDILFFFFIYISEFRVISKWR